MACIEAGEVSKPHLRGRSVFPPVAQAAEAIATSSVIELLAIDGDDEEATVTLLTSAGEVSVTIERCPEALDIMTSCTDNVTKPIRSYREKLADR